MLGNFSNVFATPQAILALFCFAAYGMTLIRTGNIWGGLGHHGGKTDVWRNSAQVLIDAQNIESSKLASEGNIDDAVGEAIKEYNEHPNDLCTLIAAGNVLVRYGDKEEGMRLLEKSITLAPENRHVRLNLAHALVEDKHIDQAIEQYLAVCKLCPHLSEPHYELAGLYTSTAKPKLALDQYKAALELSPNDALIKKNYALALAACGDEKQGFSIFEDACKSKKEDASYAQAAKSVLEANGNSASKAIEDMKIEIATKPKQSAPRIAYAQLLLYLDRPTEANAAAMEAVQADNHDPALYLVLAETNLKLDQRDDAIKAFASACSLCQKPQEN